MKESNVIAYLTDPNGKEHNLSKEICTIGRANECDIIIISKNISRLHARVRQEGHRWFVDDLDSTNGTYRNNERVLDSLEIRDGDSLKIGEVVFIFHDPDTTYREDPLPDLEVDTIGGVIRVNRQAVKLSPKEYSLLTYLYSRRGQVCSKDDIGKIVWSEYQDVGIFDYQIENLIRRLRTRIEIDPAKPRLLLTIRGLGYKLITA